MWVFTAPTEGNAVPLKDPMRTVDDHRTTTEELWRNRHERLTGEDTDLHAWVDRQRANGMSWRDLSQLVDSVYGIVKSDVTWMKWYSGSYGPDGSRTDG